MNISDGFTALAELYKRFGKGADPKEAFAHIDLTLANGHSANMGLKQVLCACAFDRGTLTGLWLQFCPCFVHPVPDATCADCIAAVVGFNRIEAFFALPIAPDDPPEAPADKPRIIVPGSASTH